MKLIYGTGNQAKLRFMKEYLKELGIEVVGIKELDYPWPVIDESGNDPLENAKIKALAYYRTCGQPVFSCDSGLFIEGLREEEQPGVHVRNVKGQSLTDPEMIEHYSGIAKSLGGSCVARYLNGICLVLKEDQVYEYMGDDIAGEKFLIVSKPHPDRENGFPLDSLSVHIETGKYYNDLKDIEVVSNMKEGFLKFFKRSLNL